MDSDITELLKSFRNEKPKVTLYTESPKVKQALQIMKDIKDKKIRLNPTNSADLQISSNFSYIFYSYERAKNRFPFPEYLAQRIIDAYNSALSFGMIKFDDDIEKEALKKENERLKKENLRYRGQLGIIEETEIPSDTLSSNAEDNE